jgi:alpha-N-arabinofuranosidase
MANLRRANGRQNPWKVRYFGIGNENWGCGGNMTPEYYSNLYRRYATYVRNYSGNEIVKIACGPGGIDYNWTDVVMKNCHRYMDALAQHYYVRGTGSWGHKGSATQFDEKEWFALMKNTLEVDEVIHRVKEIMDKYDSRKRVALFVDEWGTWWDSEAGTNPSFLYQQNTLRDALSAGIFLNIFNSHCDRVRMANIAQTVNVLQSMVLTEGEKMALTPTYHVFEMYKVHQGGRLLPTELRCDDYSFENQKVSALHVSASKGKDDAVYISVCNLNPNKPAELNCTLEGFKVGSASGRVLTAETMQAHNTFDKPNVVKPAVLEGIQVKDGKLSVTLPARSVAVLKAVQ